MKLFFSFSILVLSTFFVTACTPPVDSDEEQVQVQNLMDELKEVTDSAEESRILSELWEVAYGEDSDIALVVMATDAEGKSVITNLSSAVAPVEATLTLRGETWAETIEFIPLEPKNLYVLLNE